MKINNQRFNISAPVEGLQSFSEDIPQYGYKIENKHRVFGVIGTVNIVEQIQDNLQFVDYRQIMESLDPTVKDFDCLVSFVEDVLPEIKTSQDLFEYSEILRQEFYKTPKEFRNEYGNNFENFAHDCLDGGVARRLIEKYKLSDDSQSVAGDAYGSSDGVTKVEFAGGAANGGGAAETENASSLDELRAENQALRAKLDGGK